MGFITRCPACGTTFRVVPDQLKISDGWVRCGHCADVFDATLYLDTLVEDAATLGRTPEPEPEPEPVLTDGAHGATPMLQDEVADLPVEPEPAPPVAVTAPPAHPPIHEDGDWLVAPSDLAAQEEADFLARVHAEDERLAAESAPLSPGEAGARPWTAPPPPRPVEGGDADFQAELHRFAANTPSPAEVAEAAEAAPSLSTPFAPAGEALLAEALPASPPVPLPVPESVEPGFVRQARRRAFWQTPAMRALLLLGVLLLGVALGLQAVVQERDRLAASQPALRPALNQLCARLGCEVEALRQIDAVVIDSSALVRRLGDFYAFDFVLKNTAGTPVAMPALELSLTDTREQVLARRVFLPSELPGTPASLPANGTLSISLHLSLAHGETLAMTGYRALVFYP